MKVILKILVIALLHILSVCSITSTAQTYMTAYVESELLKEDDCVGPTTAHTAQWRSGVLNSAFSIGHTTNLCSHSVSFTYRSSGSESDGDFCSGSIGACAVMENFDVTVTYYDFPTLSTSNINPYNCVSNEDAKIYTFNTARTSPVFSLGLVNMYLQVSNSESFTNTNSVLLSKTTDATALSFSDITGSYSSSWYGQNLYYRLLLEMDTGSLIYGRTYGTLFFIRPIAEPQLISFDRSACNKDILEIEVADYIVNSMDDYKFRAKLTSDEELLKNVFALSPIDMRGNIVTLECTSQISGFSDEAGTYDIRLFGIELSDATDPDTITCISPIPPYTISSKPALPNLSLNLLPKNSSAFHVSRHDVEDGECEVTIDNYSDCDNPLYVMYQRQGGVLDSVVFESLSPAIGNTRILPGLDGGTYSIYAQDEDGCESVSEDRTLIKPVAVEVDNFDNYKITSCNKENGTTDPSSYIDGAIGLEWSGGIPPYSVKFTAVDSISTSNNTTTINDLSAGEYTIVVTDFYGVLGIITDSVREPELLSFSHSNTKVLCNGEPSDITITLNNPLAGNSNQFQLYSIGNLLLDASFSTQDLITYEFVNYSANRYLVNVTSGSCFVEDTIEVTQPNDIVLAASASKIAEFGGNTGTIDIDVNGGTGNFSYSVYNSIGTRVDTSTTSQLATVSNLSHGYYDVYIWDENLCFKDSLDLFVQQPYAPLDLVFNQLNIDCFGNSTGEIYPKASGGWAPYEYGFNGLVISSDTIIDGLIASVDYDTVFVVDSAGVIFKLPITITQPEVLSTSTNKVYNLKCFEDNTGAVKLDIIGGTTPYEISLDSVTWILGDSLWGLSAASNLDLFIRDANDCEVSQTVILTQPQPLNIANDTIINAFCLQSNGEIHSLIEGGTISGDYTYLWQYLDSSQVISNPSPHLENIYSGQYRLQISDDNNCTKDTSFLVADVDGPKIQTYSVDSVSCYGRADGAINVTEVIGGMPDYTYFINGTASDSAMINLPQGMHHVRVFDFKGCKVDALIAVNEPDSLLIYDAVITPPVCHDSYDGSIVVVPTGGNEVYTYYWNTGCESPILDLLNSGEFSVLVSDWKNCSYAQSFEVIPPAMPKSDWEKKEALICTGNYVELDGGDFESWTWLNEKQKEISTERFLSLTESGSYILQLTNSDGCTGLDTFQLEISDTPLDSKILLPDSAHVGETINVIDVTWPVPDSINWFYSQEVDILDSNDWSQHFSSTFEGIINVTLRAWYDGCFSDSSKVVTIFYEDGFEDETFKMGGALISGFRAYPNPNNGEFRAGVVLSRISDITISLYTANNSQLLDKQVYVGLDMYEVPFTLSGLNPGIYILMLQAENEQQVMKIVIN